jgi:hypothetical protein
MVKTEESLAVGGSTSVPGAVLEEEASSAVEPVEVIFAQKIAHQCLRVGETVVHVDDVMRTYLLATCKASSLARLFDESSSQSSFPCSLSSPRLSWCLER